MSDLKIYFNATDCGKAFGHTGDGDQADILNAFGTELFVACKGERMFEQQCCFISDKLNSGGKRLIKELHEFIILREQEARNNVVSTAN